MAAKPNWRNPLGVAAVRIANVCRLLPMQRASWVELATVRAHLIQARKDLDEAIEILGEIKSVKEAEANLSFTVTGPNITVGVRKEKA